jgi:hypothetical protein
LVSSADLSLSAGKNAQELTAWSVGHRRLPYAFSASKLTVRAFEASYLKDFQNWLVISKDQAKILSLILSSTKKQKNCKSISACTENTFLLL